MKSNLKPNYLFSVPLYVLDPKKKVKWINCPSFTVLNIILGCPTLWNLVIRSRFNHSCCANVAYVWNQELQSVEYRALHEIKLGEELCINYMPSSLFMKNLQTRQHSLLLAWGFSCVCSICLDETKNDANEKYAKFEKLKLDAKAVELQWHLNTGKWFINENIQLH